jgi:glycosyltransferase involved in cell wall biosynthesis
LSGKKHRLYLPLMPIAIEQLDLSSYDLVLSSSHCVAKGVLTGPNQTHVSYVHASVRYAWQLQQQYLQEMGLTSGLGSLLIRAVLHYIRMWDLRSAVGVDKFIANSRYVAAQVTKLYRQPCKLLHPPVDLQRFPLVTEKQDFYVTASRLVPYKRIDLVVKAFARMPQRRLVVIGDGPEAGRVRAAAAGHSNIEIVGYKSDTELRDYVSSARAFVFAAIEDFGIAPVEAQACGTPVIALAQGGALDTVRPLDTSRPTGVYFRQQTEDSLIAAVEEFEAESHRITPLNCRENAQRFSAEKFRRGLIEMVEDAISEREVKFAVAQLEEEIAPVWQPSSSVPSSSAKSVMEMDQ